MRVCFDCNVLVSATLAEDSVPRKALILAIEKYQLLISEPIFSEFSEFLRRPKFNKYFPNKEVQVNFFLQLVKKAALLAEPNISLQIVRDPKDDKYLELAIAGRADCIVTGDKDLLSLHPYEGINIFTPAEFLAYYKP